MTTIIDLRIERARRLGCVIIKGNPDGNLDRNLDKGPYWLFDAESRHSIWEGGLSLELIDEALNCLAKERELQASGVEDVGIAWKHFGDRSLGRRDA